MDFLRAVIEDNAEQVKYLIEQGCDPKIGEDEAQITPLHFAAQNNALETAQMLIAAGADPKQQTEEGATPLDVAKLHNHQEMVKLLNKVCIHAPH